MNRQADLEKKNSRRKATRNQKVLSIFDLIAKNLMVFDTFPANFDRA